MFLEFFLFMVSRFFFIYIFSYPKLLHVYKKSAIFVFDIQNTLLENFWYY